MLDTGGSVRSACLTGVWHFNSGPSDTATTERACPPQGLTSEQ